MTAAKHRPAEHNVYREFLKQDQRDNTMSERTGFVAEEEIRKGEPTDEVQRALFRAARSGTAVGTPDRVRNTLKMYEDQHLDVMVLVAQCGDRKHEDIMESIDLFGRKVLPEFKERHETKQRKWREEQLAGVDFPINSSV